MLSQFDVFDLIRGERAYQDRKWGTVRGHPHPVGEYLLILQGKLQEALSAWLKPVGHGDNAALLKVSYIAAVAVACLEEHGGPLVAEWLASLERCRECPGYLTPGKRLDAWTPFLEAIRGRNEPLFRSAEEANATAAKEDADRVAKVEEVLNRHPLTDK